MGVAVGDDVADGHTPDAAKVFRFACLVERVVAVVLYGMRGGLTAAFDIGITLVAVPEVAELVAFPAAPTVPLSKQLFKIVGIDLRNVCVQIFER